MDEKSFARLLTNAVTVLISEHICTPLCSSHQIHALRAFLKSGTLLNQAWSCKGKLRPAWSVTLGHFEEPAWVCSISEETFFVSELHNLMNLLFYFFYFAFVVNLFFPVRANCFVHCLEDVSCTETVEPASHACGFADLRSGWVLQT